MLRFRRSTPERGEPAQPADELYVATASAVGPACGGTELVMDELTDRAQAIPAAVAGLLSSCDHWDTLAGHARRLLSAGWSSAGEAMIAEALRDLVSRGLLLSRSEFVNQAARAVDAEDRPASITTTVWCTRDRPECLARSIAAQAGMDREQGRQGRYLVLDDGADPRSHPAVRAVATSDTRYAGREQKLAIAEEIERLGKPDGLPREVVDFALFGTGDSPWTVGANRNAALLLTGGEAYLGVDDDTEATFARAAVDGEGEAGLSLDSTGDPAEHWFYADRRQLLDAVSRDRPDIRSCHEELLGRSVGRCVAEAASRGALSLDRCSGRFAASLLRGGGRVLATMSGVCGDSGAGGQRFLLGLRSASRRRLMAPEPGYATAKVSRETLRVVAGSTISEASGCMATCMALDNRDILPPFLPVGRNEDGVFGRALGCLIPGARLGHIPWAVLHSPPEARRYDPEAIRRFSFGLGELFVLLLGTHDPGPSRLDARTRIARAGAYFVELGGMPVEDLFAFLRRRCLAALEPYVAGLEAALQGYGREPAEWADDVEAHLSATMQAATEPAFCVPADLAGGGTVEERSAAFRRLVGSYGSLLEWWPSIVGAARQAMERRDRLLAAL